MTDNVELATVEENDTVAARLDRIEEKVDTILGIMASIHTHIEQVGGIIDELQDSPIGNMLFGMMGGER